MSWRLRRSGGVEDDDDYEYHDPTYDSHKEGEIPRFILAKPKQSSLDNSNMVLKKENRDESDLHLHDE